MIIFYIIIHRVKCKNLIEREKHLRLHARCKRHVGSHVLPSAKLLLGLQLSFMNTNFTRMGVGTLLHSFLGNGKVLINYLGMIGYRP